MDISATFRRGLLVAGIGLMACFPGPVAAQEPAVVDGPVAVRTVDHRLTSECTCWSPLRVGYKGCAAFAGHYRTQTAATLRRGEVGMGDRTGAHDGSRS